MKKTSKRQFLNKIQTRGCLSLSILMERIVIVLSCGSGHRKRSERRNSKDGTKKIDTTSNKTLFHHHQVTGLLVSFSVFNYWLLSRKKNPE